MSRSFSSEYIAHRSGEVCGVYIALAGVVS